MAVAGAGNGAAAALGVRPSALSLGWYQKPTRCIGMSADGATVVTGASPGSNARRVLIRATGTETRTLFESTGDPLAGYRAALPVLGPALAQVAPLECVPATARGAEWFLAHRGEPVLVSLVSQGDQTVLTVKAPSRRAVEVGVLGLRDLSDLVGIWSHPVLPRFVVIALEDGEEVIRWFDFEKALP